MVLGETMKEKIPYEAPKCKKLGSITELTKAKTPGAADGKKSKISR